MHVARLSDEDFEYLNVCRGTQTRIGAAYQICYVKLFNRFPAQVPFEILEELTFVAIQLDIPREELNVYALRQPTISEHQEQIRLYLKLVRFNKHAEISLMEYLFHQSLQIQPTDSLLLKATDFLRERQILNPADDTIIRLIQTQREKARLYMYERIASGTNSMIREKLDNLLVVEAETYSKLYQIKEVPKKPSARAMKSLAEKLAAIERTGALAVNLNWLNNNYKRYLSR